MLMVVPGEARGAAVEAYAHRVLEADRKVEWTPKRRPRRARDVSASEIPWVWLAEVVAVVIAVFILAGALIR